MAYAVDFVLNVMKKLSSSKPVLFQRDGSLYIASAEGFGQITCGLRTKPEKIPSWEKRGQSPEIEESEDTIHRWVGDEYNEKPAFKKDEKPYLEAIAFGPDSNSFTLEKITKAAQELAELPDDGKIRMISHWSGYHSHKYGYGADGIDVGVQEARMMDRNRYLELIRKKEDEFLQTIRNLDQITETRDLHNAYQKLTFPDCIILTPYIMVSLPRGGSLHRRDEPDSWSQNTRLGNNYSGSTKGSILDHFCIHTSDESPYHVSIKLNAQDLGTVNARYEVLKRISEELNAVTLNMAIAEEFISKINKMHNEVSSQNVKWKKSLKRA